MESNQIGESNNNKFENINSQRKEKNFDKLSLSGKDENPKEKRIQIMKKYLSLNIQKNWI